MLPVLKDGDVIAVDLIGRETRLAKGDIVAFWSGNKIVVHRIIGLTQANSHLFVKTKGDNNRVDDGYHLANNIIGVYNEGNEGNERNEG